MQTRGLTLALLLMSGLLAVAITLPTANAETFDGFTSGRQPCTAPTFSTPCNGPGYTYSNSGTTYVQSTVKDGASGLALKMEGTGDFGEFTTTPIDFCESDYHFAVATGSGGATALPTLSILAAGNTARSTYTVNFAGTTTGTVTLTQTRVHTNGGPVAQTTTTPALTFSTVTVPANTFYHFIVKCPAGVDAGQIIISSVETGSFQSVNVGNNANTDNSFVKNSRLRFSACGCAQNGYVDSIDIKAATGVVGTASQTASVTGANGMSVDPTGNTIVVRTGGGNTIRTFSGGTLQPLATISSGTCTRTNGVYAISTHVLYVHCDSGGVVDSFNIRSPALADPAQPVECYGTDFCIADIPDDSLSGALAGDHSADNRIAGMDDFPIDYSNVHSGDSEVNKVYMAFAFTTTTGSVGIVTYVFRDNGVDISDVITASVAGQTPDQMCVVRDLKAPTAGRSFVYTASNTANAQGFEATFTLTDNAITLNHLVPALTQVFYGTSTTAGARGVACGEGKFAILNDNKVTLWNRNQVAPYRTITGSSVGSAPKAGSLAMSQDGGWVAWETSAGIIHVVNTTTGNDVAQLTAASGTFVAIGLQGYGCTLWDQTSTTLERWDLIGTTCATDLAYTPAGGGTGGGTGTGGGGGSGGGGGGSTTGAATCSTVDSTPGVFSPGKICAVGQSLGGGQVAGGIYIMLLLMVGMGFGLPAILFAVAEDNKSLFKVPKGAYIALGAGGIILGFVLSWSLSLVATAVVFVILVLILGVLYGALMFRKGAAQ